MNNPRGGAGRCRRREPGKSSWPAQALVVGVRAGSSKEFRMAIAATSLAGDGDPGSTTAAAARRASKKARADQQAVADAQTDVDNVNIFAKFLKKAEDGAQAAL
ncbi:hypothetical protein [Herbaspirillum hiltneri]|nr:hypothetical protein [Herbaspirillum hiltneri]